MLACQELSISIPASVGMGERAHKCQVRMRQAEMMETLAAAMQCGIMCGTGASTRTDLLEEVRIMEPARLHTPCEARADREVREADRQRGQLDAAIPPAVQLEAKQLKAAQHRELRQLRQRRCHHGVRLRLH